MFCSKCGTEIKDDACFCHKCGHQIDRSMQVSSGRNYLVAHTEGVIDRKALLVYLQRIRDLEVARAFLNKKYMNEKSEAISIIKQLRGSCGRYSYPYNPENEPDYFGIRFALWSGGQYLLEMMLFLGSQHTEGIIHRFFASMVYNSQEGLLFVYPIFLAFPIAALSEYLSKLAEKKKYKKEVLRIDRENEKLIEIDEVNKKKAEEKEKDWIKKEKEYADEVEAITRLLDDFYSLNIIPSRFRNKVYYVCYIYNMMSSATTLSFNEVIFSTQIDEAVNRIINTLNEQFERVISAIHAEGASIRRQQEQNQKNLESQYSKMLKQMSRVARNSEETRTYQQMLADEQKYTNWLYETDLLGIWR